MESHHSQLLQSIQALAAKVLATSPAGQQLHLIGGFRYRLLNASCRASADIDYHWEGDLDAKQAQIVDVLRKRLLPELKRQFAYEGDVQPATGPDSDSPAVRIVELAVFRPAEAGSRIELPIEITTIARLDPPLVRTVEGTVFLTVSDADMVESKIMALLNRSFPRARDALDVFLFQDALPADARERLSRKLGALSLPHADVVARLDNLEANRTVHMREIARLLDEQVEPTAAANLCAAGGAAMIFDAVMRLLRDVLQKETRP
jgi:predicted nucleotidyltransferase component of viral defense system